MKNTSKIIAALVLALFVSTMVWALPVPEGMSRTVILIDGDPFLVDMDEDGHDIDKIVAVPTYFTSPESHDLIVDRVSSEYEEELPNMKSRLLVFTDETAILDNVAVNHIRDMARLYSKGFIETIHISAAYEDSQTDEVLAAHRIKTIYQMLKDFGVSDRGITADMKKYKSDLPNVYVRLNIE